MILLIIITILVTKRYLAEHKCSTNIILNYHISKKTLVIGEREENLSGKSRKPTNSDQV